MFSAFGSLVGLRNYDDIRWFRHYWLNKARLSSTERLEALINSFPPVKGATEAVKRKESLLRTLWLLNVTKFIVQPTYC